MIDYFESIHKMELDTIHNEDALAMRKLPADSVDLIATDPPYGIAFMGRAWDQAIPSVAIWRECLRVLKPGAFAYVMCIPRQDCLARMIISLEDAGFIAGFTSMYWAYASGFPKAQNIGKAVDKRNGRLADEYKALGDYLRKQRGDRPQKDISKFFPSKTGGLTGCVANWELGLNVPTKKQWVILKRELNLDSRFDELIEREEAEREIIGIKKSGLGSGKTYAFTDNNVTSGEVGITLPATSQAQALDGSYGGFQPKPAVEVVLVAMKPLSEKTYVDQALKNGKGVTWLDTCRVPTKDNLNGGMYSGIGKAKTVADHEWGFQKRDGQFAQPQGRFPSHLLVSDDVLNDGRVTRSGKDAVRRQEGMFVEHHLGGIGNSQIYHPDSGSFSRYFSLDAWFDKKLKELPAGVRKTFPFLIVPKASKSEKNRGCEGLEQSLKGYGGKEYGMNANDYRPDGSKRKSVKAKNYHPTVKPTKLFSYLITLGSRQGDTVLDPFIGSGTTAIAARMLGRRYIGYEMNKDYCEIARARLSAVQLALI